MDLTPSRKKARIPGYSSHTKTLSYLVFLCALAAWREIFLLIIQITALWYDIQPGGVQ